jgi:hypothetical protein
MYARAVDDAAARLRGLRQEEREDLALAGLALGLAVAATQVWPAFALPLLLGGLVMGALGLRAVWRHWDLIERLSGERDAYVIPEVLSFAARETTVERRQTYANLIRSSLGPDTLLRNPRILAAAGELEALASELDDRSLALDPAAAVECKRLVSGLIESTLFSQGFTPEELRSRVRQIRDGFSPVPRPWPERSGRAARLGGTGQVAKPS